MVTKGKRVGQIADADVIFCCHGYDENHKLGLRLWDDFGNAFLKTVLTAVHCWVKASIHLSPSKYGNVSIYMLNIHAI